jgi:hypothetical protein
MGHFIVLISMLVLEIMVQLLYWNTTSKTKLFIYGHLSLDSLEDLTLVLFIKGQQIAALEIQQLTGIILLIIFQVIKNMGAKVGDYPGVCTKANWISI